MPVRPDRLFEPAEKPRPDYQDDPDNPNKHPSGVSGPVVFPPGEPPRFKVFMWELVNAFHQINQGLAWYKKAQLLGMPDDAATAPYQAALDYYHNIFVQKWQTELDDYTTWLDASVSTCGFITDVRVITTAFASNKPGQSSDQAAVEPHPSSSSSSA